MTTETTDKQLILNFPKEIKIQCLKAALEEDNLGMFLGLSRILLEAPLNKGGLDSTIIQQIHTEYLSK